MKTLYHCLILWIPFVLLFSLAIYGIDVLEGNKIRTTEYIGTDDFGPLFPLFNGMLLATVLYPVSFLPLTFVVSLYVQSKTRKILLLSIFGGLIGAIFFKLTYNARFVEEYDLNIISAILFFGVAGILFSIIEILVKRNLKFS